VRISIVLVVVILLALALGGSTLMSRADSARDVVSNFVTDRDERGQSASQLSPTEYVRLQQGVTRAAVRSLAGEPDTKRAARVEGLEIDCWYYGIVGTTGTFQLCFSNGKLATRARFDAAQSS
jgi:hypothetical protein